MIVTGHVERYDTWLRGQAVKTSPFHGGNTSSNLVGVIKSFFDLLFKQHADVAQLAEQLICNQQVIGSSPIIGFIWMASRAAKGDRL